ncbi:MAG TPA: glycine cleavage system aminomethyltransferase GcvT [Candidatus Cloacimonetes bacterium]|nr:glycine cleavage system aminomethyltransferase GcvT [Candidatus Cloacimonadota bacterium]HEX37533.1 glycine cleavage system aminomethyltransferase GcvT [Candidatus Cloacimonadota bacterium]
MVKRTPFYNIHKKLKAKIIPFAGFEMPIQYPYGIVHEHRKVRESVGMFDLSHMGEFIVRGPNALDFLQKTTVNDVSELDVGQVQYSNMCYADGGIVDDLLVYRDEDYYYLVVNASNIDKDYDWLHSNLIEGVTLDDVSDETALIGVQGSQSEAVVQKLMNDNLSELKYYHFIHTEIDGTPVMLSRTGYTGEDGFEIYFTALDYAEEIWEKVAEAGQEFAIEPIGLGARDTLRLEMKYPLYGNDIDKDTNPLEAGLRWVVKFDKGDFIGKEALEKVKAEKIQRKLVPFVMDGKGIPRPHYKIFNDGQEIGEVRSGTMSPSLGIGIGTGYVHRNFMKSGTQIEIEIRDKMYPATIIKPPFYKEGTVKSN